METKENLNIVILDRIALGEDMDLSRLNEFGKVTVYQTTEPNQVIERLKDADVVLTNKVTINKEIMDALPKLKYIGENATGTNNIDLSYAAKRNIAVTNVKSYSTDSVVQHTFALLFYVYEKLRFYDDYVKDGSYARSDCFTFFGEKFSELSGRTWGIIGLGEIGRKVAQIAKAFGCRVIYYSTSGKNNNPDFEQVDFDTLLMQSDIISIHAPLNEKTNNLMDEKAFSKMKKNAVLINVGRGPIINDYALYNALINEQIAGAALDVVSNEPINADNPLLKIKDSKKLIITPHIAWATTQARQRLVDEIYENLLSFTKGERKNRVEG